MENRDLIPELKRLGITVASHSSALEPDAVQKALEKLGPKQKTGTKSDAVGRPDRHADGGGHHPAAKGAGIHAPIEELKPDKRRILIKRKRDEPTTEEPAPFGHEPLAAHPAETAVPTTMSPLHPPAESPVVHHEPHAPSSAPVAAEPPAVTKPATPLSPEVLSGKKKVLEELQTEVSKDKLKKLASPVARGKKTKCACGKMPPGGRTFERSLFSGATTAASTSITAHPLRLPSRGKRALSSRRA